MRTEKLINRRKFIKTGLIFVPVAALTRFTVIDLLAGSSIKARTVSSVTEKRISLSNSHFSRAHGVSTWNKLRVAARFSMTDTGAGLTGTPEFAMGLCAGGTNIYRDTTTDHFIGLQSFASTWDRGTVSAVPYYDVAGSTNVRPFKKVGSTVTNGSAWSGTTFSLLADAATAFHRVMLFLDILKGSPNYTFSMFWYNPASLLDVSSADFAIQAANQSPSYTTHIWTSTQTVAVDESANGTLDRVNFHWDQATPQIELSEFAVVRLS